MFTFLLVVSVEKSSVGVTPTATSTSEYTEFVTPAKVTTSLPAESTIALLSGVVASPIVMCCNSTVTPSRTPTLVATNAVPVSFTLMKAIVLRLRSQDENGWGCLLDYAVIRILSASHLS